MSNQEPSRRGLNIISTDSGTQMTYTDLAFTTAHPPDVPLGTRIVAVCGITDMNDDAAPGEDGWFFSDFYLFHHLFHPIGTFSDLSFRTT